MRVVAFSASPRKNGNSTIMLQEFVRGAEAGGAAIEVFQVADLHLHYCRGCLRCNLLGRCALRGDDWQSIAERIRAADRLVFASPVYFHHVSAPLKKLLDRFRSFLKVRITETGLEHHPWETWQKEFIVLLSLGSSDTADAQPIIELFKFMVNVLGSDNRLTVVTAPRLAVPNQIRMDRAALEVLYRKLSLPENLAAFDGERNYRILDQCYRLGCGIAEQ